MDLQNKVESFYESADKAEHAFYLAFGEGNIQLMKSVIADKDVSFMHPDSSIIVGRNKVMDYWKLILTGIDQILVESKVLNKYSSENIEVHLVSETFEIAGGMGNISQVITTNVYVKQTNGWRLQMQHASNSTIIRNDKPCFMGLQDSLSIN